MSTATPAVLTQSTKDRWYTMLILQPVFDRTVSLPLSDPLKPIRPLKTLKEQRGKRQNSMHKLKTTGDGLDKKE